MLQFIRAQRDIIERILQHIEMPSFSDLLVRIIQLDEQPAGAGVLEVCLHSIERPLPSNSAHTPLAVAFRRASHDETRQAPFPGSFTGYARCGG